MQISANPYEFGMQLNLTVVLICYYFLVDSESKNSPAFRVQLEVIDRYTTFVPTAAHKSPREENAVRTSVSADV